MANNDLLIKIERKYPQAEFISLSKDLFAKISELTNEYNPPSDACQTYKVTFAMLKEYEQDLHKHIHLENNILFKKAIELEEKFNILG